MINSMSEQVCTLVWLYLLSSESKTKTRARLKGVDEMEVDEIGLDEVGEQEFMYGSWQITCVVVQ